MSHWFAAHPSALAAAAALCVLWLGESLAPFFLERGARTGHGARNLALGLINGGVRAAFFPAALLVVSGWAQDHDWGLMRLAGLWDGWGGAAALVVAVLALDLVNYAVHVASHYTPWLWRFHCVHHHDEAVDSTTALRFHVGDVVLTAAATLATVGLLGLRVEHVLVYEAVLMPLSIFHHGNVRIPERVDRVLRAVIVTPRMHWVHHSRWHVETDSNYSGIFSFWDRLFGTFRLRREPAGLELGLDGYDAADHATLRGCLATPFGAMKSLPGRLPDGAESGAGGLQAGRDASGRGGPLASPSTHPSRGRHLPLALAVASSSPDAPRTLRPCVNPGPE